MKKNYTALISILFSVFALWLSACGTNNSVTCTPGYTVSGNSCVPTGYAGTAGVCPAGEVLYNNECVLASNYPGYTNGGYPGYGNNYPGYNGGYPGYNPYSPNNYPGYNGASGYGNCPAGYSYYNGQCVH